MFSCQSALLLLLAGLLAGCQANPSAQTADGSNGGGDQVAAKIRQRYQRVNPNNRVGIVSAVKADAKLVAIGDIPVQDFGVGDVLVFIDRAERVIASGVVVNATPTALHARYEAKKREPRVGDLAVHLPN